MMKVQQFHLTIFCSLLYLNTRCNFVLKIYIEWRVTFVYDLLIQDGFVGIQLGFVVIKNTFTWLAYEWVSVIVIYFSFSYESVKFVKARCGMKCGYIIPDSQWYRRLVSVVAPFEDDMRACSYTRWGAFNFGIFADGLSPVLGAKQSYATIRGVK